MYAYIFIIARIRHIVAEGQRCCKSCRALISTAMMKCFKNERKKKVKEKKKDTQVIFFSLFSVPNVSVVYTFETFNVYVFYTSTDIFLVLFYKWQEFKKW